MRCCYSIYHQTRICNTVEGRFFITATCLQFARQFPAHMRMLLSKPIWINLAVRFHETHCQMFYWALNMPHPQFSLHTFILEWLVREIFRHAYLSMKPINFHLQFHFDLQRHLGIQFLLVSCCDLGKNILVLKKKLHFQSKLFLLAFPYSVPSQLC